MSLKTLAKTVVMLLCLMIVTGCKPQASTPNAQEEVKTSAEYKAEAEKEITTENMDKELASLEQAVEAEATETP